MQISKRLQAVADMVSPGVCLADVGTDHGYVPIFLVRKGRISSAVAMDINRGPLERARLHIGQYGLDGRIETRLSDGLEKLLPGEADSILIAGMGGMLTVRILERGQEALASARELILQPQSDIREVRLFLKKNGYQIRTENMVEEDGKFYPMMRAERSIPGNGAETAAGGEPDRKKLFRQDDMDEKPGRTPPVPDSEKTGSGYNQDGEELCLRYGPVLLEQRHPVLLRYLEREHAQLETVREKLSGESGPSAIRRLTEIKEDLRMNEAARALYKAEKTAEGPGAD